MTVPSVRVVGAAIVRNGRLLAARRTTPPALAGRWELPGGKVEVGETDDAALVRELFEELGVMITVHRWLRGVHHVLGVEVSIELRIALAHLVAGEPCATEHDELRWLSAEELDDVDWLEPDRPFLDEIAPSLGS